MTTAKRRPLGVAIAALAAGLLATVGLALPAQAASTSTIDSGKTGELIVHKFEDSAKTGTLPNDGTAVDTTGLTPLAGATFTIQQVPGVDLTTNQGWTDAAALTVDQARSQVAGVTGTSLTTDAGGTADFTDLPLGLYLVTETQAPAGHVASSAPFLVTVPLTDPDNLDAWLYQVNVYPKNTLAPTKSVSHGTSIGDPVTWTITSSIPTQESDQYVIKDTLDGWLSYTGADVTLTAGGQTLVPGTDFTVDAPAAGNTNTLSVTFTPAGLTKLAAAKAADADATVQVVVHTTVNSLGDELIPNTAYVFPNSSYDVSKYDPTNPGEPGNPGVPTNTPKVTFGNIDIKKTALDGTTALQGAGFQVYTTEADAKAGTNAISINGVDTWTTDANGKTSIQGLSYTGSGTDYWVVETKAPAGYELAPAPFQVTVSDTDAAIDLAVKDAPHNAGFTLPLTGGAGTAMFTGIGLALVALAGAVYARSRKRQTAK